MIPSFGANPSPDDPRTIKSETLASEPLIKGGVTYTPNEILNQHKIGKCTAISLIQNREKADGRSYSDDFQYLLQKKLYDPNWDEGSSILSALKVGKNYGFLPLELWTHTTISDSFLSYSSYVTKLQSISDSEVQRLMGLCVNKLKGYAMVDNNPQAIAHAVDNSTSGVLCRYEVGKEWFTTTAGHPSWNPKDIDPLRPPKVVISGHAIVLSNFDYSKDTWTGLSNGWGTDWNRQGNATCNYREYAPTEVWTVLKDAPLLPQFIFNQDLHYGDTSEDVRQLQKRLGVMATGYFGDLTRAAVIAFQDKSHVPLTWSQRYIKSLCLVGKNTRLALNS